MPGAGRAERSAGLSRAESYAGEERQGGPSRLPQLSAASARLAARPESANAAGDRLGSSVCFISNLLTLL